MRTRPANWVFLLLGISALVTPAPASAHPRGEVLASETEHDATLRPNQASASIAGQPEHAAEAKKEIRGYTLSPEKYKKAAAYNRSREWLYFIGVAYGLVVWLLVLRWRLGPVYRNWVERLSSRRFVQAFLYAPLLLLTVRVLNLPRSGYAHWLVRKYGLSVQGWGSWFWDWAKGQLVGVAVAAVLVWLFYGIVRRSPRRWWFYAWMAALPILVFVVFLEPVVIEPMFFRFDPLEARHPQLVDQIESVVQRGGLSIPRDHLFEMRASEKLNAVNAYVTGIGASKRVVVWDTTIAKLTPAQVLAVFGHEMGHYVLGHIPQGMIFFAAMLLVFLYVGSRGLQASLGRWGARWAIRGQEDWASLPVILLLASVFSFVATPLENAYSRRVEHQADVYGLEVTHGIVADSGEVAAQSHQILAEIDLEEPDPPAFIQFWLYTHPAINERIIFARTYDPWAKGQLPRYVR